MKDHTNADDNEMRQRITQVLIRMGVPMRTRGWDYLRDAVMLRCTSELTDREMYARIGAQYRVSAATARNGCRSAVLYAYESGCPAHFDGFLPEGRYLDCGGFIAKCAAGICSGTL